MRLLNWNLDLLGCNNLSKPGAWQALMFYAAEIMVSDCKQKLNCISFYICTEFKGN